MNRLKRVPALVETWEELTLRLMLDEEELERMLGHLEARCCPRKWARLERVLEGEIDDWLYWIDLVLQHRPPIDESCAEEIARGVWEYDLWRPLAVDRFHALLEAQGESYE